MHRNHPLYTASDFNHGACFSRVLREYWDTEPYLRIVRQAYKERLLNHDGPP